MDIDDVNLVMIWIHYGHRWRWFSDDLNTLWT